MPYYKSKKNKEVILKLGKRDIIVNDKPKYYDIQNLHTMFPNHIEIINDVLTVIESIVDSKNEKRLLYLHEILNSGDWKNERCFIIGGGPSLLDFDFNILKGGKIIAINKAFINVPFADIMFGIDKKFYNWASNPEFNKEDTLKNLNENFKKFKGIKIILKLPGEVYSDDISLIKSCGDKGISDKLEDGIYFGANSGYGALNLAICLGANPIYLLGYDMKQGKNGESHYHSGYPQIQVGKALTTFLSRFPLIADYAKEKNINIINLSTDSKLKCFKFDKIENLKFFNKEVKKDNFIVVSFYTKDSEYENDIKKLKESLDKFSINYDLVGIPKEEYLSLEGANKRKNWNKNTCIKAKFIRKMIDKHKDKDIVWIDADAIICSYPFLFNYIKEDIGVYYLNNELLSGTLFFKNNEVSKMILDNWINEIENNKDENLPDQRYLQRVIEKSKYKIKIFKLLASYTKIFDIMKNKASDIIVHYQASRRLLK